jgi:predicted kinase
MALGNSAIQPVLILLSGLPGSGKTTFAHALLDVLPAIHIESDAIRRQLVSNPRYVPAENAAVFGRVESFARKALVRGQHVIIDATNLTARDRRRFVHLAAREAGQLICVRLTAPEATIGERLSRPRTGFSQATLAVYEEMRSCPRPFTTPVVVVDTRFPLGPSISLVGRLVTASLETFAVVSR